MKKSNIYTSGNKREINPNWFTNSVKMKDISSTIGSKQHNIYHVSFENGAKTKLHVHDGNQILIVTKGMGSLEFFKKTDNKKTRFGIKKTESVKLVPGDIVYIPKNTLHTHGSTDKKHVFSHIAINIIEGKRSGYRTTWLESDFKGLTGDVIP